MVIHDPMRSQNGGTKRCEVLFLLILFKCSGHRRFLTSVYDYQHKFYSHPIYFKLRIADQIGRKLLSRIADVLTIK